MSRLLQTILLILLTSITTETCRCRPETTQRNATKSTIRPNQANNLTQPTIHKNTIDNIPLDPNQPNGITNVGNTCFMNVILQSLAALYIEDIKNATPKPQSALHQQLIQFLEKINTPGITIQHQEAISITDLIRKEVNAVKQQPTIPEKGKYGCATQVLEGIHALCPFLQDITYKMCDINDQSNSHIHQPQKVPYLLILPQFTDTCNETNETIYTCNEAIYQINKTKNDTSNTSHTINDQQLIARLIQKINTYSTTDYSSNPFSFYIYQEVPDKIVLEIAEGCSLNITDEKLSIDLNIDKQEYTTTKYFTLKGMVIQPREDHYTAYIKKQNQWYYADDDKVTRCTIKDVVDNTTKAEIFFYEKI